MLLIDQVDRGIIRMCFAGSSQLFFSCLFYKVFVACIFSFLFQWCFGRLGTEEILLQEDAIVSRWPHWKTSQLRTIRKVMYGTSWLECETLGASCGRLYLLWIFSLLEEKRWKILWKWNVYVTKHGAVNVINCVNLSLSLRDHLVNVNYVL